MKGAERPVGIEHGQQVTRSRVRIGRRTCVEEAAMSRDLLDDLQRRFGTVGLIGYQMAVVEWLALRPMRHGLSSAAGDRGNQAEGEVCRIGAPGGWLVRVARHVIQLWSLPGQRQAAPRSAGSGVR